MLRKAAAARGISIEEELEKLDVNPEEQLPLNNNNEDNGTEKNAVQGYDNDINRGQFGEKVIHERYRVSHKKNKIYFDLLKKMLVFFVRPVMTDFYFPTI